jgi:glyoxylase-like metal-dependent hydrolase (beta-lactamase superfamily II)
MNVITLKKNPTKYSCNSYFIRGNWNAIPDINTLIDPGIDGYVIDEILNISTGVGKSPVEQVILTHEHFDHAGGLKEIISRFHPKVIALTNLPGVTNIAYEGMQIKIGDQYGTVLLTPGHSNDSICIYCQQEKVLFSGDTPINIKRPGGSYTLDYLEIMERIASLDINIIYSGHDYPYKNVKEILKYSIENVRTSIGT